MRRFARGLLLLDSLLDFPVPETVVASLNHGHYDSESLSPEAITSQKMVDQITHTQGLVGSLRLAFRVVCPPGAFMRFRYPDQARKPLLFLYLIRWWAQARKVFRLLYEKMRRKPVL